MLLIPCQLRGKDRDKQRWHPVALNQLSLPRSAHSYLFIYFIFPAHYGGFVLSSTAAGDMQTPTWSGNSVAERLYIWHISRVMALRDLICPAQIFCAIFNSSCFTSDCKKAEKLKKEKGGGGNKAILARKRSEEHCFSTSWSTCSKKNMKNYGKRPWGKVNLGGHWSKESPYVTES